MGIAPTITSDEDFHVVSMYDVKNKIVTLPDNFTGGGATVRVRSYNVSAV